jgi:hypothetical protein
MAEYVCENGTSWPKYEDYVFNLFGYSNYDGLTRGKVIETLTELERGCYFIRDSEGYEWAFQSLLLGVLCSAGLTEYGSSPRGSWLTEKGKKVLAPMFLKQPAGGDDISAPTHTTNPAPASSSAPKASD